MMARSGLSWTDRGKLVQQVILDPLRSFVNLAEQAIMLGTQHQVPLNRMGGNIR